MPDSVVAWVSSLVMDLPRLQRLSTYGPACPSVATADGWLAARRSRIVRSPRTRGDLGTAWDAWLLGLCGSTRLSEGLRTGSPRTEGATAGVSRGPLGKVGCWGFVVRHGPVRSTPGPAHHERGWGPARYCAEDRLGGLRFWRARWLDTGLRQTPVWPFGKLAGD